MGSVWRKVGEKQEIGCSLPSMVSRRKFSEMGDRLPDLLIGHFQDGGHRQSSVDPLSEPDGEKESAIWKGGDRIPCQVRGWRDQGAAGRPISLARIAMAVRTISQKKTLPLL